MLYSSIQMTKQFWCKITFQSELQFLIDQWNENEAEKKKRKELEEIRKQEIKNEDPKVEYRRRLIERFSYKNTELINRIYAENKVLTLEIKK